MSRVAHDFRDISQASELQLTSRLCTEIPSWAMSANELQWINKPVPDPSLNLPFPFIFPTEKLFLGLSCVL